MFAIVGLILGIALGIYLEPTLPVGLQPYLPIAIVAALASLLPAMVIAWCSALDVIGQAAGLSTDGGVLALMIGFSVGTLGGGGLALAATAASRSLAPSVEANQAIPYTTSSASAGSASCSHSRRRRGSSTKLRVGWTVDHDGHAATIVDSRLLARPNSDSTLMIRPFRCG